MYRYSLRIHIYTVVDIPQYNDLKKYCYEKKSKYTYWHKKKYSQFFIVFKFIIK